MKNILHYILNKALTHPAWAGIGVITAILTLLISMSGGLEREVPLEGKNDKINISKELNFDFNKHA